MLIDRSPDPTVTSRTDVASAAAIPEGVNFAAVNSLPLVVVVENNGYAYSTPTSQQSATHRLAVKAKAEELRDIEARVTDELDSALAACEGDPLPEGERSLPNVYENHR